MNRLAYKVLADLVGPLAVVGASLKGRFGGNWKERFGLYFTKQRAWGTSRLWFHGASVGEAKSAAAVINSILNLAPATEIYLTVGTPAGLKAAKDVFSGRTQVKVLAAPVDFWGSAQRALTRINPDALVIMETELWPNLIFETRKRDLGLILAAGRLTERSLSRYLKIKAFMTDVLSCFDLIAVSGDIERERFAALGAQEEKLAVLGNPKFDHLLAEAESEAFLAKKKQWAEKLWGDSPRNPLVVIGSTHPGEDEAAARAFEELIKTRPDLKLVIAPRHLNRVDSVVTMLQKKGFTAVAAGQAAEPIFSRAQIAVLDVVGQMSALYALADVAVVGGSLFSGLMGHNPLEPAAVKTPVVFGPYMASFAHEAQSLIKSGGALETKSKDLGQTVARWLDDSQAAQSAAQAAYDCLAARRPAAPDLAEAILAQAAKRKQTSLQV